MLTFYVPVSMIIFVMLGIVWSKKSNLDLFCKMLLFGMGIWGICCCVAR